MSNFLYRIGRGSVRHRRMVLLAWFVGVMALFGVGKEAGGQFHDKFEVPGVESQQALDLLQTTFPAQAGGSAQVVFHAANGTLTDASTSAVVADTIGRITRLPHVAAALNPFATGAVSVDGTIALANVQYDAPAGGLPANTFGQLEAAVQTARDAGLQVEFGGEIPMSASKPTLGGSEGIGILAAMVILIFAFGSVIAMGLPIGTALFGLGAGLTTITFLSAFIDMPSTSEAMATMIGLGVGIDYALFIITRHRAGLHRGLTVEDAAGRALATAGQAVVVAGGTVVIAICGLAVAGIPMVTFMGIGAAIVVTVMVAASLTMLPALIGFAGHNIDRFGIPGTHRTVEAGAKDADGRYHGWARWSHHVSRHPVRYLIASLAVVLAMAAPMLQMRLGQTDASQNPTSSTLRRSYDLLAEGFGPGFNGPLILAVELGAGDHAAFLSRLTSAVAADPGVAVVAPPMTNPNGSSAVIRVNPTSAPQDSATSTLVTRLRTKVLPSVTANTDSHVYVGGQTATFIDLSDRISSRLPLFIGAVIGLSFLLLMIVFRSILVPLKAALMNVLSIGAAYGVIVAVFQKGWGASLIGVHESLPIISFIPMFMFAILFGLSMDYEVFLLSRVREEYLISRDNTESVVVGINTTARVITSAALIMISVFLSFVFGGEPTIKMMGLGLATAVFVDATIIRMILVPATMRLLGDANWWMPRWLDRMLPNLDIEGESKLPPEEFEGPAIQPAETTPILDPDDDDRLVLV